jgi:hypothetical protein
MKENIPDFQTLMLPLMELLRDNKEHLNLTTLTKKNEYSPCYLRISKKLN